MAYPIDIAPDGKSFVAALAAAESGAKSNLHLTFVLNFFDEVKRACAVIGALLPEREQHISGQALPLAIA